MANRIITLQIPEELAQEAEKRGLLTRERLIVLLLKELAQMPQKSFDTLLRADREILEGELALLLPPERLEEGLRLLREGKPIPGLFSGDPKSDGGPT